MAGAGAGGAGEGADRRAAANKGDSEDSGEGGGAVAGLEMEEVENVRAERDERASSADMTREIFGLKNLPDRRSKRTRPLPSVPTQRRSWLSTKRARMRSSGREPYWRGLWR